MLASASVGSLPMVHCTAGAVAAGLDGVRRNLHPGAPGSGDSPSEMLPMTLLHAMDALEADQVLIDALDAVGPGVAEYFAKTKREEFFAWHNTVSAWEIDHYLTAF